MGKGELLDLLQGERLADSREARALAAIGAVALQAWSTGERGAAFCELVGPVIDTWATKVPSLVKPPPSS
jgi:hypothetical protein